MLGWDSVSVPVSVDPLADPVRLDPRATSTLVRYLQYGESLRLKRFPRLVQGIGGQFHGSDPTCPAAPVTPPTRCVHLASLVASSVPNFDAPYYAVIITTTPSGDDEGTQRWANG